MQNSPSFFRWLLHNYKKKNYIIPTFLSRGLQTFKWPALAGTRTKNPMKKEKFLASIKEGAG